MASPIDFGPGVEAKVYQSPLAEAFAEASMMLVDLSLASKGIDEWAAVEIDGTPEASMRKLSLFCEAVIRLMGCFGTAPYLLDAAAVYKDTPGGLEYFQWLKDVRDAYVAHRFGSLRTTTPCIVIESGAVVGLAAVSQFYHGPTSGNDPLYLKKFAMIACAATQARLDGLSEALLVEAKALTPEKIADLPSPEIVNIEHAQIRMNRQHARNPRANRKARQRVRRSQAREGQ